MSRPLLAALAAALIPLTASAQVMPVFGEARPETAAFWRASARLDVEAAYSLLKTDHPGADPAMGDRGFRDTLERAHAQAAQRADQVKDFGGYAATLTGFANAFGDKHVRARPLLQLSGPEWAGVILARQGERWMVVDEAAGTGLIGSELISCDGRTPEDLGREILGGFRADWQVDSQKVQTAPWLLVSEGNPFVAKPKACDFATPKERKTVTLEWRPIRREALAVRLVKANAFGQAGFGLRKAGDGWWISVQSFDANAAKVVDEVKAHAAELQAAPFVILDVRGNGGGSSIYGDQIAAQVLGEPYVKAVIGPGGEGDCDQVIRVSERNIAQIENYKRVLGPSRGPEFVAIFDKMLTEMKAAKAKGQPFSGPTVCRETARRPAPPPKAFKGRLYILTDGVCFSSCLTVVSNWRDLGAVQIGRTTDANTHYSEVRDDLMPSGLSTFSTMMAVSPSTPLRLGPFEPAKRFEGDIADTKAVEAWAVGIATAPGA